METYLAIFLGALLLLVALNYFLSRPGHGGPVRSSPTVAGSESKERTPVSRPEKRAKRKRDAGGGVRQRVNSEAPRPSEQPLAPELLRAVRRAIEHSPSATPAGDAASGKPFRASKVKPIGPEGLYEEFFDGRPEALESSPVFEEMLANEPNKWKCIGPYCFHPDSEVRLKALKGLSDFNTVGKEYLLVNALADADLDVRSWAARTIWEGELRLQQKAVRSLMDERSGGDLGPAKARSALEFLAEHAPSEDRRNWVKTFV